MPAGHEPDVLRLGKMFADRFRVAYIAGMQDGQATIEWRVAVGPGTTRWLNDEADPPLELTRRGSIDLLIEWSDDEGGLGLVILELKNTNWDRIQPSRVVPNAGRHRRQVWRYLEAFIPRLDDGDVVSLQGGLVYPSRPKTPGLAERLEAYLSAHGVELHYANEILGPAAS